ncbi:hypothetical protein NN561_002785 [Cricetulus griseus]
MNQLISRPGGAVGLAPGEERRAAGASGEPARVRAVPGFQGGSAEVRERAALASGEPGTWWRGPGPTLRVPALLPRSGSVAFLRVPSSRLHPRCFPPIPSGGCLECPQWAPSWQAREPC